MKRIPLAALAALTLVSGHALAAKPTVEMTFDRAKIGPGETATATLKVTNPNQDATLTVSAWCEYDDVIDNVTTHVTTPPVSSSLTVDGSIKNPALKAQMPAGVTVVAGSLVPSGPFVSPVAGLNNNTVSLAGSLLPGAGVETLTFQVQVPKGAAGAVQVLPANRSATAQKENQ